MIDPTKPIRFAIDIAMDEGLEDKAIPMRITMKNDDGEMVAIYKDLDDIMPLEQPYEVIPNERVYVERWGRFTMNMAWTPEDGDERDFDTGFEIPKPPDNYVAVR